MAKLIPLIENSEVVAYLLDCPGCNMLHELHIQPFKNQCGASWSFNGDLDKPTFTPSTVTKFESSDGKVTICHSFITDGKIKFLSDCTHELAGQTFDLLDMD